ncbi:MAG: long-chain fatty acid--CoA ligase [Mycobacteriaceae bacterium]
MNSTMQTPPLLVRNILQHGQRVFGTSEIVTYEGDTTRRATFDDVAHRAERLAGGLAGLGVSQGDRVATFLWNTQEHQECYLAIPSMGAVLHTLNLRLAPEQLAFIINHAQDKIVIVDSTTLPLLARVVAQLTTVEHFVVVGDADKSGLPEDRIIRYEDLLASAGSHFDWPDLDESSAAAMCYTSGTTGDPKGVVYSHRSTYLHALASATGNVFGLTEHDIVLPVVPMFHANAWGLPYAAWFAGADLLMPGRFLQVEHLARMIESERPTLAGAVPTIWNDLLIYARAHSTDLSSLRLVPCGGSAVARSLMENYEQEFGVRIVQAWGMTETSPLAAVAAPPKGSAPEDEMYWRSKTGRVTAGVEVRLVDGLGTVLPWDGQSVGEIQVRGPWITGSYYGLDDEEKFMDGWLRTGDVAHIDPRGFLQITDRTKDVIKSGGEWISSVDLENTLMGHPEIFEAAVIAVPDDKWQERPLACVVRVPGSQVSSEELRIFLTSQVAKWWLPERWAFLEEVPKTSVGKFDKKVLRARYADGALEHVRISAGQTT